MTMYPEEVLRPKKYRKKVTAGPTPTEGQVFTEVTKLTKLIESFEGFQVDLELKLASVLTEPTQTTSVPDRKDSCLVPLAEKLEIERYRLVVVFQNLNSILDRIEL